MKTLILFVVILFSTLNAESILNFGLGLGQSGGLTSPFRETPSLLGINFHSEYEAFFQTIQSVSFRFRYSGYSKKSSFISISGSSSTSSNAYYLGVSYNITNAKISEKHITEISPIIAYGFEKITWRSEYTSLWSGTPELLSGNDYVEYISFGLSGALGIKKNDIIYKLRLSIYYDHILYTERTVIADTTGDVLDEPKYKTDIYGQLEFTIGFIL